MERESNLYLMREVIRAHHEYIMSVAISMQSVIQKERSFNSYRVSIKVSIRGWSERSIRTESQLKSQSQGMERAFNSYQVDPFGCRTHPAPDALHTCSGRRRCSPAERLARYAPMLQRSCDQGRAIIVTPSASTQRLRQRSVSHRVIRVSHLVYWRMRHNQRSLQSATNQRFIRGANQR